MTVRELRDALATMPDDLPVLRMFDQERPAWVTPSSLYRDDDRVLIRWEPYQ